MIYTKKFIYLAFFICIASLNFIALAQEKPNKLDLFGYYHFDGAVPEQLQDIDHLHLSTIEIRNKKTVKVPLYGFFRFRNHSQDIYLINPILKGNEFIFSTKTIKGINYQFSGRFLKIGNFPEVLPNGHVILVGRLIKNKDRKKLIELDVKFTYYSGE